MEKFRNLTNNIFFKIFLGFVGLSFVIFGISSFFLNRPDAWIAKIDGHKVSYTSFLQAMQKNKERIYRSNPQEGVLQYLNSPEFKVDTLNQIVREKITDSMKDYYGIYPDKELILKTIAAQKQFIDFKGDFNRIAFLNFLKINNLTEEKYIQEVSKMISSQIMVNSLLYDPKESSKLLNLLYNDKYEKRAVDVVIFSLKDIPVPANPTNEELAEFFNYNKDKFTLPELRKVSYIEFSKNDINLGKKDLTEDQKNELILAKIEEIEDDILTLNSLPKVAQKFNFKVNSLNNFDKTGLNSNNENAVKQVSELEGFVKNSFDAEKQETTELFYSKTNDKYYVIYVDSIQKARQRNLDEVKGLATKQFVEDKRKKNLSKLAQRVYNQIQNKHKSPEDVLLDNNVRVSGSKVFDNAVSAGVDKDFIQNLFSLKIGKATYPRQISDEKIEVTILKKIVSPQQDQAKLELLKQKLSDEFKINILNLYNNYLQQKFRVEINEKLLNNNSEEQ